jgi:hypothetical protein
VYYWRVPELLERDRRIRGLDYKFKRSSSRQKRIAYNA